MPVRIRGGKDNGKIKQRWYCKSILSNAFSFVCAHATQFSTNIPTSRRHAASELKRLELKYSIYGQKEGRINPKRRDDWVLYLLLVVEYCRSVAACIEREERTSIDFGEDIYDVT